ncbi:helix-turn-helix transcriptional regulator [Paenibacillus faecis]|uniref:Helix-turn-helix transcriptional regulator n=1 Tax=Paenibacillus faecis TaxID=862114 RepID=A0A5D0CW53_9BACL|nr:helix-turn-helix domain-containing protein [Paenibacillus faecis]TYA13137.1 helix-turn-helix transcriptional regulator [Paenibacillus faecis]
MTPRTKEQNEQIRNLRMSQILKAAADVYLERGQQMEIRDVAAEAGLGYGTVYHYYKNKMDLLHDLMLQAMSRAEEILLSAALAAGQPAAGAAVSAGPSAEPGRGRYADARAARPAAANGTGPPQRALAVKLLQAWAEDHAFYLACRLGGEQFRPLPEAQAEPLAAAFREQVLRPLAAILGALPAADPQAPADGGEPGRRAEWLLAALTGCALAPLRRGTLRDEAVQIAAFLF